MNVLKLLLARYAWKLIWKPVRMEISSRARLDFRTEVNIDETSSLVIAGSSSVCRSHIRLRNAHLVLRDACLADAEVTINNASVDCEPNLRIHRSRVNLVNSHVSIGEHCQVFDFDVSLIDCAEVSIGKYMMLRRHPLKEGSLTAAQSVIRAGDNNRIEAVIKCRNSCLTIGSNNFINHGSEIRCEKSIHLGDHIFVSYDAVLFDTNTHSTKSACRVQEIINGFPNSTLQTANELPETKAVRVGSRVWIGMRAAVLKGANIGDDGIVALSSVVTGTVPAGHVAYGNPARIKPLSM
jgi:acetyltransferase-like isoleucine patch superfamily enzyme